MKQTFRTIKNEWVIIIILVGAFVMRVWGLTFQSLWLDELHNMNEADPGISWGATIDYLKCCDQHPPLYFLVQKLAFKIFGYTEFVARFISVLAGTLSIWAVWLLGKEILNRSLGTIAGLITCVNYYNLFYSQEARVYIFAFLFATLSLIYFMRLIKSPKRTTVFKYAIFSLCLLYSHYYSLFVIVAQGILALLFLFLEPPTERKLFFGNFLLSFTIIVIGYIPWIPAFYIMSGLDSFWISDISPAFLSNFFYDYFGNADLVKPFLLVLLLTYVIHVSLNVQTAPAIKVKDNPLVFSFCVFVVLVLITYLIPYLRSFLVVPMLFARYTIVVLPAFIIAIAYGIELFKLRILKYLITVAILVFSFIDIFFVKKYYIEVRKTQFREMTEYVVKENNGNYPIINQLTAWHQQYYFKIFKSKAKVFTGSKDKIIDSIVSKRFPKWEVDGFWIVGAHGDQPPDDTKLKELATDYILLKQKKFQDAWAQLFVSKSAQSDRYRVITYNDFAPNEGTIFAADEMIAVWGGIIHTKPVSLESGTYNITVTARGTDVKGEFPHINLYSNEQKFADYNVSANFRDTTFKFDNQAQGPVVIKVDFDNDMAVAGEGDRNLHIKYIVLKKL